MVTGLQFVNALLTLTGFNVVLVYFLILKFVVVVLLISNRGHSI